jgi:hypothetical protein
MNERTFTVTNGAQLAMGIVVALLLALAALVLSTKPAEAVKDVNSPSGGGGNSAPDCYPEDDEVPANDHFSAAQRLPWFQDLHHCGNNYSATLESYEPQPYSSATSDCGPPTNYGSIRKSVWYKITPTYTTTVSLSADSAIYGAGFNMALALYKDSSLAPGALAKLSQLNCDLSHAPSGQWVRPVGITKQLQAGQTYYVQFSAWSSRGGLYKLHVNWASCYYSSSGQLLCPVS